MRQRVGERKIRQMREKTGLAIKWALVRGGTNHRVDLRLEDGTDWWYYPRTGEVGPHRAWEDVSQDNP